MKQRLFISKFGLRYSENPALKASYETEKNILKPQAHLALLLEFCSPRNTINQMSQILAKSMQRLKPKTLATDCIE